MNTKLRLLGASGAFLLLPGLAFAAAESSASVSSSATNGPRTETRSATRVITAVAPHEVPAGPVTFLGVETSRVDPTLTEQLGLQKEVGLVVNSVVPDSPAAAVLRRHDILLKLNDQLLIGADQLGVLIRTFKDGDEVTLTYVRAGRQETAKVKLAQRTMPRLSLQPPGGAAWQSFATAPVAGGSVRVERVPGGMPPQEVQDVLTVAGGHVAFRSGAVPLARIASVGQSNLVFTDEAGSIELRVENGSKSVTVRDSAGKALFDGPVNTDEERRAMPDAVRVRLEKMEGIDTLQFNLGPDFPPGDVRVVVPHAQGVSLPHRATPAMAVRRAVF